MMKVEKNQKRLKNLYDKKRAELENMSERQWQFISKCWDHNQRIWKPDTTGKLIFKTMDTLLHFYHLKLKPRIRKGLRMTQSIKIPGIVGARVGKECDPKICSPDEHVEGRERVENP